ncbi:exodeoxyribonuclease VII large subunit [Candidatus Fermentibacteria bacterium]|nr:exodeoxyribonuclease VII large subunit [Candidatus Fermentibacteria bacterium]
MLGNGEQLAGVFWLTVSQLTQKVKAAIEGAMGEVWVQGELSGVKLHQPSGHLYFSLKDEACLIRAAMFRRRASTLGFVPAEGDVVLVLGRLTVFERQGQYQMVVDEMVPAGAKGMATLKLEMLKARLSAEGIFDSRRKRELPAFPAVIGVVTSSSGAAIADIIKVVTRRWPAARILVSAARVQGEGAPASIVKALVDLSVHGGVDVIIVGRGGGAKEDLSCFNDEAVVRAIVRSAVPVVSAVGHEVDMTLADLAADARAPTPSAAAEVVVPDRRDLAMRVNSLSLRARRAFAANTALARERIRRLGTSHGLRSPKGLVQQRVLRLDDLGARLRSAAASTIRLHEERIHARSEQLNALDPRAVLGRGYTLCLDHSTRALLSSAGDTAADAIVDVVFHDGEATCQVTGSILYE